VKIYSLVCPFVFWYNYIMNGDTMKIKSALGYKGMILYNGHNNYYFRVNQPDGTYKDYDILHSDLEVFISDVDAYFYEDENDMYLDHSPETLGIKNED